MNLPLDCNLTHQYLTALTITPEAYVGLININPYVRSQTEVTLDLAMDVCRSSIKNSPVLHDCCVGGLVHGRHAGAVVLAGVSLTTPQHQKQKRF